MNTQSSSPLPLTEAQWLPDFQRREKEKFEARWAQRFTSVIYLIRHTKSGREYIGQKRGSLDSFFKADYWGGGVLIMRAMKLFGSKGFSREVIWVGPTDEATDMEEKLIKKHKCLYPYGFNLARRGKCSGARLADYGSGVIQRTKMVKQLLKK